MPLFVGHSRSIVRKIQNSLCDTWNPWNQMDLNATSNNCFNINFINYSLILSMALKMQIRKKNNKNLIAHSASKWKLSSRTRKNRKLNCGNSKNITRKLTKMFKSDPLGSSRNHRQPQRRFFFSCLRPRWYGRFGVSCGEECPELDSSLSPWRSGKKAVRISLESTSRPRQTFRNPQIVPPFDALAGAGRKIAAAKHAIWNIAPTYKP